MRTGGGRPEAAPALPSLVAAAIALAFALAGCRAPSSAPPVAAAEAASDAPTAWLVLLAAQDGMGRIVERLPVRRFAGDRQTFETLSREVGVWRDADDVHVALATAAPGWRARFDAAVERVARRERQTYFNEATLRRALR